MFYAGEMTEIPGSRPAHAFMVARLGTALMNAAEGSGARVTMVNLQLRTGSGEAILYPDVMAFAGRPTVWTGHPHVVTDPVLIAEVLAPETEELDRGLKAREYRATPSVKQYAYFALERPFVDIYTRLEDGSWGMSEVSGLDVECEFSSLGCRVSMADVYEGVFDL